MVEVAESWAALMPLEADIRAWSTCWEKVAFNRMMVREISTVALSTEARMRLLQSWGLFWRSSRCASTGVVVMRASRGWDGVESTDCDRDMRKIRVESRSPFENGVDYY